MSQNRSRWAALALMVPCGPLFAHHGTAGTYDQTKVVQITGTVKQFIWRNPHVALVLTGKDQTGKEDTYSLEVSSPGGLAKEGYNKNSFKPGDSMTVSMHPSFNNPTVGQLVGRTFVLNGKQMVGLGGGATEQ